MRCFYQKCHQKVALVVGTCRYCNSSYCLKHRLPEEHTCKNMNDCKVCMIQEIIDIPNLVSLKIVGREKALDILLKDIKFIQSALEFYPLAETKKEFIDFNIINHKKNIKKDCSHKNCEIYNMYYN